LPADVLLVRYANAGGYADCFVTDVPFSVSHADYVEAFYTTWLFKLERLVLLLVAKRSTDTHARQLARGERASFAAWSVEARAPDQLLVCDYQGKTRSWLMIEPGFDGGAAATRLYFGTGIVPVRNNSGGRRLSLAFRLLLPFHKQYARALLRAARARLASRRRSAVGSPIREAPRSETRGIPDR
jgi:hypothetical protein